jgi:hypothetical protein
MAMQIIELPGLQIDGANVKRPKKCAKLGVVHEACCECRPGTKVVQRLELSNIVKLWHHVLLTSALEQRLVLRSLGGEGAYLLLMYHGLELRFLTGCPAHVDMVHSW